MFEQFLKFLVSVVFLRQGGNGRSPISTICSTNKFKCLYADRILTPQGATVSSFFLVSNESVYFSHHKPNSSASNSLYFGSYSKKCTYSRYTNFYFLMYFRKSLIRSVTYLFLSQERK